MAASEGEKRFAPTAKRRQDAAERGDVVRSRELATAVTTLLGTGWLVWAGPWLLTRLTTMLRDGLTFDARDLDHFDPGAAALRALTGLAVPVLVLGLLMAGAGLASQLGLGDGRWNMGNLAPRGQRINPLAGLGRMFGVQGLIELAKGLAKVLLLGTIAWSVLRPQWAVLVGLGSGRLAPAMLPGELLLAWGTMVRLMWWLGGGLLLIALVDVPVQMWRRNQRLMMSLQDIRDEAKDRDGNPQRKSAIRNRQRQIARAGVHRAVREAKFIVTNPQHFAVALDYDPDKAPAPFVIARAAGEKALAMRELAAELDVPCLEYPVLARALYFTTREAQMIREELYIAVAAVLAFVLSLRRGEAPLRPVIEVPMALRFDAEGRPEIVVPLGMEAGNDARA